MTAKIKALYWAYFDWEKARFRIGDDGVDSVLKKGFEDIDYVTDLDTKSLQIRKYRLLNSISKGLMK